MRRFALILPLVFLSFLIIEFHSAQAQPSKNELAPIQRLEKLLRDLEALEREGRQILENQDATIAEINSLKIWARKR